MARLRALRPAASVVLFVLGLGLVAGVLGYMHGARLLVSCVLIGGALALALFASVKILCAVAAFGFRVWPLRLLHMVRRHRDLLERRTRRVLVWLAIVAWLVRVLDYVGLLEPALSFGKMLLAAKLERGSISVSVEDVLAFVLTVWAAYLLSAFIRFVLQEDVYPRRKVPHGMAYAASRLLHYVILALGLVVGMGVLGVDLTKVTVLVGAFGVGTRLRAAKRGEQLCLGPDPALRTADPRGRHRRSGKPPGAGTADRHPLQHCAHLSGSRDHRSQFAARLGAGDQLDAERSASAH